MKFFDSHAHLDDEKFNEDREELIEKIYQDGIEKFVSAGYSLESSKRAIELSKKYNFIYATCGISPNDIPQTEEELWKSIEQVRKMLQEEKEKTCKNSSDTNNIENSIEDASCENLNGIEENKQKPNKKLVAVGEIGLDYYWQQDNKELQKKAFIEQIKIANEFELPIVIHTREAVMDTLEILKQNPVIKKGIFHCCPLNRELVKEALKLDFYISFAGPVTFKNSKNADEIISMVPNERMLIETDSPYLSPEPLRGRRNDPRNVKLTAGKVASVKGLSIEEVAQITYENAMRIFEIKKNYYE